MNGFPSGWQIRSMESLLLGYDDANMPRISEQLLECVFYVYASEADADAGERNGGSGFIVGARSSRFRDRYYPYAVTCRHVIADVGPSPVLRLNTKDGGKKVIPTNESDWHYHLAGDDVAACYISILPPPYQYRVIPADTFILTEEVMQARDIGPGDEVFMIGRVVDLEGRQFNTPLVRFGNIARMPVEPIYQEKTGYPQESFVIEARSIPGYSGSPVFVHIPPWSQRPNQPGYMPVGWIGPWLLGIDWGHSHDEFPVLTLDGKEVNQLKIKANAGMALVVPAWKLAELLNQKKLVDEREWMEQVLPPFQGSMDGRNDD